MSSLRDYEIRDEIGSGAYGAVYRAWQPAVGREVAIKVIRPEHTTEPEFVERFEAEAQMVARLEHPTIVPVYDYWRDESGAYLVMRLLGGGSLKDRLRDVALSLEEVLDLAGDICDALAAAHDQGVVHRDLKPANILFDERGNAYLTDFGIAKNLAAEVKLTQTGAILGTPDYISPEQIRGEELTPAADQYSLGIVLFEALAGRVPYPDLSVAALFQKHLMEPLPPLASVNPELPAEFDAVLQRATAKEPGERYPGITGLAEALGQAASFQPSAVSRQPSDVSRLPAFLEEGDGAERERPVFVGRQAELEWLNEKLSQAMSGRGNIAFVVGDAGSGKSALLSAFAEQAAGDFASLLVAWGSCSAFSGSGEPYLPFRDIFATLAGDVESRWAAGTLTQAQARALWEAIPESAESLLDHGPDLIGPFVTAMELADTAAALPGDSAILPRLRQRTAQDPAASSDIDQSQLFGQILAVLREIASRRPLLLLLDDLQWADSGSVNLLFHLGRRLAGTRILIIGACRQDELALATDGGRHPLLPLLDEFKSAYGDIFLDLSQEQERSFVDDLIDSEPNRLDESFRAALFAHTGGHPLFTVELLRDMQERGVFSHDADGRWVQGAQLDWSLLPARVEGVIEARIGRLEEELRDILSVAAVEGEDFTAQVVARVQDVQERRLLRTLSRELDRRHRLVREGASERFDGQSLVRYSFAHALFQQYLYNDLGAAERRLLHADIAAILEELYAAQPKEVAVQLAWHYAEADERDKALPHLLRAGDNARNLYAAEEAVQHYERALVIYKDQGDFERASRMLMKLGLTYHSAFDYERSQQAYEEAFKMKEQGALATPVARLPPAPHALRTISGDVITLDPGGHTTRFLGQLFSGLISLTPDLDVVPDIARGWEILDGGRTYIFHLREDVRWSDGQPVTAHDFVLALQRALDPAGGSPAASNLYDIRGASTLHQGRDMDSDDLGVEALGDWTLRIALEQPCSYFLYILNHVVAHPVPSHVISSHGDAWTDLDKFVSCGPFLLDSFRKKHLIVLKNNPAYHGVIRGNVDKVEIRILREEQSQAEQSQAEQYLRDYENDKYDILNLNWWTEGRQRAIRRHADEFSAGPRLATYYVSFDVSRPPFDDIRVRQAFVLATDRRTITAVSKLGAVTPATGGFIPVGMPGHVPGVALPYNLERARQLLADAGYPGGQGFPRIDALISERAVKHPEPVIEAWRANLGVEIVLEVVTWGAFLERIHGSRNRPHIFSLAWGADYPDPDSMMRHGLLQAAGNWSDDGYDRLVERARRVMDQEERMRLYRQAEEILVREAPFFPLYYLNSEYRLVKPWVRNYIPPLINAPAWKDVIIDPH